MPKNITLNTHTPSVLYLCKKDKRLAKVISMVGEISYSTHDDGYDFLVHEIIEQMLSIKAGNKIYERLKALCGNVITPESISNLSDEDIGSIGTSKNKVSYIRSLTEAVLSNKISLRELPELDDKEIQGKLMSIKGIGKWTADMYLIFVLDRQDVLPVSDVAFLQAFEWIYKCNTRSADLIKKKCQKWKPYSSIAARYLYRALDMGLTKDAFHL